MPSSRPQQNGVAERANRTMADDISAMLYEAHVGITFHGNSSDHARCQHQHSTATVPQIPPPFFFYRYALPMYV